MKWLFRNRTGPIFSPSAPGNYDLSTILKGAAWVVVAAIAIFLGIMLIRIIGAMPVSVTVANVLSREQVREAMESGDALALGTAQWMDEARRLAGEQDFRGLPRAVPGPAVGPARARED